MQFTQTFKEWLKTRRVDLGMTQDDLAECLRFDVSTIRAWEGGRATPRLSSAKRLADCLAIPNESRQAFYRFATGHVDLDKLQVSHDTVFPSELISVQSHSTEQIQIPNSKPVSALWSEPPWINWPIVKNNPFEGDGRRWRSHSPWQDEEDHFGILLRSVVDGWFHMEVRPKSDLGSGWGGMMFQRTHGTFYVAVDVMQPDPEPGNSCGIMFGARNNANYQIFSVRGFSQEYLVSGVRDDVNWSIEPDIVPTYLEAIRGQGVNRLAIYAVGDEFTFIVNSVVVSIKKIKNLPGDYVDVIVIARQDRPAVGMFTNFELREPS